MTHSQMPEGNGVTPTPASKTREQHGRADKQRSARVLKAFHEEERFGKAYDARLTKRLWGYLLPYRWLLWASVTVG